MQRRDLVCREHVIVQPEVTDGTGEVLIEAEYRPTNVVVDGHARVDQTRGGDGKGVGAAGDVLAVVVETEASAVGGFDGEGDGFPSVAGEGTVRANFGLVVPVGGGDADAQLGIACRKEVAVAEAGFACRVADAPDEVLPGLFGSDVDFDAGGQGAEVADEVIGELDVVVDAV